MGKKVRRLIVSTENDAEEWAKFLTEKFNHVKVHKIQRGKAWLVKAW